jgi:hypothetical protein
MGHPQQPSPKAPHEAAHNEITTFDIQPPFGASFHATMTGARLQHTAAQREQILTWLQSLPKQYELATMKQEELVECPDCHGKLRMNGDAPVLCMTCLGMGRVTRTKANNWITGAQAHVNTQSVPSVQGSTQEARIALLGLGPAPTQALPAARAHVLHNQTHVEDQLGPTPGETYPPSHATVPAPAMTEVDCEPPEMLQQ